MKRVLIVDDERHNRQVLEVMLEPEGYSLLCAASGEEALEIVAREVPDLILLDVMMPGLDGYQVATQLKSYLATKNIPIIMVTALDDREARLLGLSAGAEEFLSKPVDRAELCVRVRNLLRLKACADFHDRYSQVLEAEVIERTAGLVESERLYRTTFDTAPVGIVHVSLDGRWLRVNTRVCEMLGIQGEALGGLDPAELTEPLPPEEVAVRRSRFVIDEKLFRARDGTPVWMRVNVALHREQHYIWVLEDITERKLAEQELARNRQRLSLVVDQSVLAVIEADTEGFCTAWNRGAEHIFGHSRQQMLGQHLNVLTPPDLRRDSTDTFEAAGRTGSWRCVLRNLQRNGREIDCEWFNVTLLEAGSFAGVASMCRDITTALDLERELAESRDKFKHIFDTMQDGYMRVDLQGIIQVVNPTAIQMLGYPDAAAMMAVNRRDLHVDSEALTDLNLRLALDGRLVGEQITLYRADRSAHVFQSNIRLHRDADGQPAWIEIIFNDANERVMERQARQAADEANRLKSQFLANMSHEIRTPLNAILGMAHLALRTELSERQQGYLEHIQDGGKALLRLVDDILDFSKADAGKMALERVEVRLEDVLQHVSATLSPRASEKGLKLRQRVGAGVPAQFRGDPTRLGQVLLNLVGNAIKFTARGEVGIAVNQVACSAAQICLSFAISDTGAGLTADQIEGLFVAFSQADSSITRKYGGTGLGLAICKRLVGLMGGQIGVVSVPGEGSTFTFTALFEKSTAAWAAPVTRPVVVQARPFVGFRILLVEDNLVNQQIAREMLEGAGLKVDVCGDGRQALKRLEQGGQPCPWDLVLMDLQMPVLDGYRTTAAIREHERFAQLPIVAVTAHVLEEQKQRCFESGMNDYISKPIDLEGLLVTLKRWLPQRAPVRVVTDDTRQAWIRMTELLEACDGAACQFLAEFQLALDPLVVPGELDRFAHLVRSYDLITALAELAPLASRLSERA